MSSLGAANSAAASTSESDDTQRQKAVFDNTFDDRFVLLHDETDEPAAFTEYAIEREDGRIEHGITNSRGETHWMSATTRPEKIRIYVAIDR